MNDTQNRIMTVAELRESAAYWQQLLRLQDWRFDIRIVRGPHHFPLKGHPGAANALVNAQVFPNAAHKLADLKIIDPIDYVDEYQPQDMECDLVHELLHVHIEPFMPKSEDHLAYTAAECAINMIAGALVKQRREIERLSNGKRD